jgi:hypothetical protein
MAGKFVTLYPLDGGPPTTSHRVDARDILAFGKHSLDPVAPGSKPADSGDIGLVAGLTPAAVKALRKSGITTAAELRSASNADLRRIEALPVASLDAIERFRDTEYPMGPTEGETLAAEGAGEAPSGTPDYSRANIGGDAEDGPFVAPGEPAGNRKPGRPPGSGKR